MYVCMYACMYACMHYNDAVESEKIVASIETKIQHEIKDRNSIDFLKERMEISYKNNKEEISGKISKKMVEA